MAGQGSPRHVRSVSSLKSLPTSPGSRTSGVSSPSARSAQQKLTPWNAFLKLPAVVFLDRSAASWLADHHSRFNYNGGLKGGSMSFKQALVLCLMPSCCSFYRHGLARGRGRGSTAPSRALLSPKVNWPAAILFAFSLSADIVFAVRRPCGRRPLSLSLGRFGAFRRHTTCRTWRRLRTLS
jgi:hypothetical protein